MKFSVWFEQKSEIVEDAILGTISSNYENLGDREKKYLLQRNTEEFSRKLKQDLLDLGVIKNIKERDRSRYETIENSIDRGILVSDLIRKITGDTLAPKAKEV